MQITLFSFLMAVLWSSILIIFLYIGRSKKIFLKYFGVGSMTALYLFCTFRMVFPFEFPFTLVVGDEKIYPFIRDTYVSSVSVQSFQIPVKHLLFCLWFGVAIILIIIFIVRYYRLCCKLRYLQPAKSPEIQQTLQDIQEKGGTSYQIKVLHDKNINSPMSIGVLHRYILLPDVEYTDNDLHYILLHEYTHIKNRDLLVKLLINLYCCVFWWNPVSYLLKVDLAQTFELKCDLCVSEQLSASKKADYLTVIISELQRSTGKSSKDAYALSLSGEHHTKQEKNLEERFHFIVKPDQYDRKKQRIVLIIAVIVMLFLSYSFIIQSRYITPIEEIEVAEGVYEIPEDEVFILKAKDGDYWLFFGDITKNISEEQAQEYQDELGLPIKME